MAPTTLLGSPPVSSSKASLEAYCLSRLHMSQDQEHTLPTSAQKHSFSISEKHQLSAFLIGPYVADMRSQN
jgi:hypothetical protein